MRDVLTSLKTLLVNYEIKVISKAIPTLFDRMKRGVVPEGDIDSLAVTKLTFQRSGVAARIFEESVNVWFLKFHSLLGHYVLKSKLTGRLYDLVDIEGVDKEEDLQYTFFCKRLAVEGNDGVTSDRLLAEYARKINHA
jgi:hypothetical protein